jgi:trk system potassium uptake protein TrkH
LNLAGAGALRDLSVFSSIRFVAMSLRAHLTPLDLGAVLGQLAGLVRMLGWLFALPAAIGWLYGELVEAGVISGLSVVALALGHWGRGSLPKDLHLREAFVVTALAYPLFALAGAIAFLPVAPFIDGFFESMSGFTTTGLTVLDLEALPKSLLFLRAYMQWIGGAGIVVLSVAVWNATRPAGFRFRMYGSGPEGERLAASVHASARQLIAIYGLLTAAVCVAFIVGGMSVEDAVLHGLATISTGGFSPHTASIGRFASNPVLLTLTMFGMLMGATSFGNYQRLARHSQGDRQPRDPQLYALAMIVFAGALLLFVLEGQPLQAVFDTVSAVTTTGFSLDDPTGWSPTRKLFTTIWMAIGGSSGSTAGGLKLMRLIVLFKLLEWTFRRSLLPQEAQVPLKYAGTAIEDEPLRHLLGFMVVYLLLLLAVGSTLVLAGFAPQDAFFESASAIGTVGLSSGITDASLPTWIKLLLSLEMWAGRLEVLPVLVLLYPGTWKRRRGSR